MDRLSILVDNRIRINRASLPEEVAERLRGKFTHKNPQWHKLKSMGYWPGKERAIIRTWTHEGAGDVEELTLPRGGMQQVRGILWDAGIPWTILDHRTEGNREAVRWRDIPECGRELWDHQESAVDALLSMENNLVRTPTGAGKTEILIAAMSRAQLPSIIIVWESGLLKQWQERLGETLGLRGNDLGLVRAKTFRLRPVTLAMQQTLNRLSEDRWIELDNAFGLVGCDEVSKWAAATFLTSLDRFSARYRVGMSADETRRDKKEFLIHDLFGRVSVDISSEEMIAKGIILDVEIRVIPTEFRAPWYRDDAVSDDKVPNFNRLLDEMTVDAERNSLAVDVIASNAVDDKQVLAFSHRVDHCERLDAAVSARGCLSGLIAGDDGAVCDESKAGLKSGKLRVAVGTFSRIAYGINLPSVDVGVVTTPIHNNRQNFGQVRGRLCRRSSGKSKAVMYYLWDQHVHGKVALYNLRRWNKVVKVLRDDDWLPVNDYIKEAM